MGYETLQSPAMPPGRSLSARSALSLILPVAMIPLLILAQRRDVMGSYANGRVTKIAATAAASVVLALNLLLVLQTFGLPLPPPWP